MSFREDFDKVFWSVLPGSIISVPSVILTIPQENNITLLILHTETKHLIYYQPKKVPKQVAFPRGTLLFVHTQKQINELFVYEEGKDLSEEDNK